MNLPALSRKWKRDYVNLHQYQWEDYCVSVYEMNGLPNDFIAETKVTGKKWCRFFLSVNEVLSIRKPEGVSIQRAHGYNRSKMKISLFEEVLRKEWFLEDGSRRIPVLLQIYSMYFTVIESECAMAASRNDSIPLISDASHLQPGKSVTCLNMTYGHLIHSQKVFEALIQKELLLMQKVITASP